MGRNQIFCPGASWLKHGPSRGPIGTPFINVTSNLVLVQSNCTSEKYIACQFGETLKLNTILNYIYFFRWSDLGKRPHFTDWYIYRKKIFGIANTLNLCLKFDSIFVPKMWWYKSWPFSIDRNMWVIQKNY